MNKKQEHTDLSKDLFSGADIPWEKSKADIWTELEKSLDQKEGSPVVIRRMNPRRQVLALAASLTLLLAITSFMKFYTVKTITPAGVRTSLNLPDGSSVELNAVTTVKYQPYWWFISRKVALDGEAFFTVEKGKKFRVVSDLGSTEVLGTTFNVFARGANYQVSCHTGSVRVNDLEYKQSVVLSPKEIAKLEESGGFSISSLDSQGQTPGWTQNLIMFSSAPLSLVFEEIERQYGIVIETAEVMQQVYSGNFSLDQSVENILSLLCLPFGLEYEHQNGNTYLVYPSGD